ncbi:aldehyde dehydrogenase family protein [Sinorhizobium sp. BG8]|nr:aldehyde dehydrogenase family protein [Sinorhizobium sp. BG8]QRM55470.1 aldehyde dehydrogenase family protein [Sinorhizobium sp. BG8]
MPHESLFFIDGKWHKPQGPGRIDLLSPATHETIGTVAVATPSEVHEAVRAARRAFDAGTTADRDQRRLWLTNLLEACRDRSEQFARSICEEVGIPIQYCREVQIPVAVKHLELAISLMDRYEFETTRGGSSVLREPIGVVGMITPWNWPLVQIVCKVAPAIAAGCTMVLKPSEVAPSAARLFAEAVAEAGLPAGVFNLVEGDGPTTGEALVSHPDVDMISFTGSTRAGVQIAKLAANTVKRVTQELGGKSPFIVLPDADLRAAVTSAVSGCMDNNGQTCDAPTRLLVPEHLLDEVVSIAAEAVETYEVGLPQTSETRVGPLVSITQFQKVQDLINSGIQQGARVVAGGTGRPETLEFGNFVKPTVFSDVTPDMRIWREEIFGPVLSILPYQDENEAIHLANDTEYGLAAYVHSANAQSADRVARRLRTGSVYINSPDYDFEVPFGGYKQSGNGREYGAYGIDEFMELKSIVT